MDQQVLMESAGFDVSVVKRLGQQVKVARDELKNIRTKLNSLSLQHAKDACRLELLIRSPTALDIRSKPEVEPSPVLEPLEQTFQKTHYEFRPIGYIRTVFKSKNGTPRQPTISPSSKGYLELDKALFTNPEHCLEGLEEFSHVWLVFVFHKNGHLEKGMQFTKSKIQPPRLDGRKLGVFATRSPYRPTPIGLSLVKIRRIEGGVIHFNGLDLVDGTPILDVKPYIAMYDKPKEVTFRNAEYEEPDTFLSKLEQKETASIFETRKPVTSREIMTEHKSLLAEISSLCAATANSILFKTDKYRFDLSKPSTSYKLDEPSYDVSSLSSSASGDYEPKKHTTVLDRSEDRPYTYSELWHDFSSSSSVASLDVPYREDTLSYRKPDTTSTGISRIPTYSTLTQYPDIATQLPERSILKDSTSSMSQIKPGHSKTRSEDYDSRSILSRMSGLSVSDTLLFRDDSSVSASWITDSEIKPLSVCFTLRAQKDLVRFHARGSHHGKCDWCFDTISSVTEAKRIISDVLKEDPRSVYRRKKCSDQLYYFTVDNTHVTCWFDNNNSCNIAEILRVFPASTSSYASLSK